MSTARGSADSAPGAHAPATPAFEVPPFEMQAPEVPALEILAPGPLATVQDAGRPGHGDTGVGRSGAADLEALAAANRLVGNPPGAAGIEATLGGLAVRALRPLTIAVTGPATRVDVDGRPTGSHSRIALSPGARLAIAPPRRGLRNYLAVRGGVAAVLADSGNKRIPHGPELGSLATDTLSGLGPPPLVAGDALAVSRPALPLPATDANPRPSAHGPPGAVVTLPVVWGPREDWFTAYARRLLLTERWTATQDLDRVGVRMRGPGRQVGTGQPDGAGQPGGAGHLERTVSRELVSEPMVTGALQVPPGGGLVLFLADHPVTGGYPVIAVLRRRALARAAQLRPGDDVRFTE